MTILNIVHKQTQVMLFSDTLAISSNTRMPFNFVTKVFHLPHIDATITVTGAQDLLFRAYTYLISNVIYEDFEALSEFMPNALRTVWSELSSEQTFDASTTIYAFGLNTNHDAILGFAYRSANDFESEPLAYGHRIKPPLEGDIVSNQAESFDDFVRIAIEQQRQDRILPLPERVGIGGDLIVYELLLCENGVLQNQSYKHSEFPMKHNDWQMIVAQLPANLESSRSKRLIAKYQKNPW